jgi:hypothetical protein
LYGENPIVIDLAPAPCEDAAEEDDPAEEVAADDDAATDEDDDDDPQPAATADKLTAAQPTIRALRPECKHILLRLLLKDILSPFSIDTSLSARIIYPLKSDLCVDHNLYTESYHVCIRPSSALGGSRPIARRAGADALSAAARSARRRTSRSPWPVAKPKGASLWNSSGELDEMRVSIDSKSLLPHAPRL